MSEERNGKVYARPIRAVKARERSHAGVLNPNVKIDEATARAIFLSEDSVKETATRFGVPQGSVGAIWARLRWSHATRHLTAPKRKPGGNRTPRPKRPSVLVVSPEIEAVVRRLAGQSTPSEIAREIGVGIEKARRICKALGVKCRKGWTNDSQPTARDDFKPTPLPPDWTLDAPAGSAERIAKLRERADSGYELWGPNDYARPLPRCEGKIERPQMENVT